mmetsp:Transcript_25282/g.30578  ORF Transcript_25282/g.30578 Transcript_25282/m.30578 type:complete len:288 (-) Transcript_25282:3-866(-)
MPPNAGEIYFEDLESTFDPRTFDSKFITPTVIQQSELSNSLGSNYLDWDDNTIVNGLIRKEEENNECEKSETIETSESYWLWNTPDETAHVTAITKEINKEEFIKRVVLEEGIRKSLSAEHIVTQLVNEVKIYEKLSVEYDNADDFCNEEEMEGYWYWGDFVKEAPVGLELCVEHIERLLLTDAEMRGIVPNMTNYELSHHDRRDADAYWEWKEGNDICEGTFPFEKGLEKEEILSMIMLEEEIRQLFTVESIENSLISEAGRAREKESKERETVLDNNKRCEYWLW